MTATRQGSVAQSTAHRPVSRATATEPRHAVFHRLRVAEIEPLTDDSVAITFEVPDALREAYRFTQGQHVTIRCDLGGPGVRRNYSICAPATTGQLRIGVKRVPGGSFSSYAMQQLRPGDELDVMTPTGRFFTELDPTQARHYVAIVGGSGITPILSILASALEIEPRSRFTLLYGNRTTSSIMFLEELEDLKNRYPARFALLHFLSRETQEAPLFDGRLDRGKLTTLLAALLSPDDVDEWFLCGPYDMMTQAKATLVDHGVDQRHVHLELFHAEAAPRPPAPAEAKPGTGSQVRITLDGRETRFELSPSAEVVLDAVLRVRADAPYACKGGVCGTCRAKLVEGSVAMDQNYALEDAEIERGYVLTCQSHPTSDQVVLDYDA
jgi:ring-1,2-phenylacetyl-CoA epoxidase subunit PaaE